MKFNGKKRKKKVVSEHRFWLPLKFIEYKKEYKFDKENLQYEFSKTNELIEQVNFIDIRQIRITSFRHDKIMFQGEEINITRIVLDSTEERIVNMNLAQFIAEVIVVYDARLKEIDG